MFRPQAAPSPPTPLALAWQPPALPVAAPRRKRRAWCLLRLLIILAIWSACLGGLALLWFLRDLPRPDSALDAFRRPTLTLQDSSGATIATYGDIVGEPLRLKSLPKYLPDAAVAVEDRRFWVHGGLDPWGMLRALAVNLRAGHIVQGGSTITQQVAKTLFLTNARTFRRKIQEVFLTFWLERHFTKAEILEIWLNRVYLGSGAWGVDAAAHLYFGISARNLSLWQSAVLAGLPRAPSRFNPRADPSAAAARAREVLGAMVANGTLSADTAAAAGAQIHFSRGRPGAGWFADWAAAQAEKLLPENADSSLRSTLDSRLQSTAQSRLNALLDGPGRRAHAGEGAVVVLDADTGAVRAMVGGRVYEQGAYNRATQARRQPGSAFKPFVWLTALEHGLRPDDMVLDAPLHVGTWSPQNFEPGYRGEITLEEALAQSINTAAVRLMQQSGGPGATVATARRLGIDDRLPDVPALALGTGEVGLLELTAAYAAFFNGGHRITPHALDSATVNRTPYLLPPAQTMAVIDPAIAAMMAHMMAAVVARGTGRAAAIPGHLVAGKTGTTQDNRDAWFIGAVDGKLIGVWIGNDAGGSMRGVMGGTLPAMLFRQIAGR